MERVAVEVGQPVAAVEDLAAAVAGVGNRGGRSTFKLNASSGA